MGDELLHSPTPIGQGPRRGAYIVGNYEVVAGVEVDGHRSRLNMRTSQNSVKAKFAQCGFSALGPSFFDATAPAETGHIGQTVNARGFSYATCSTLQPLVARQFRGRGFGIESTADVLLTKPSTRTSSAFRFYGICRKK
jgi:hypothetical protein